jgi:hypothetical protein
MSKAEKFIRDCTRKDGNQLNIDNWSKNGVYEHWLTPDVARKAAELASR